MREIQIPTPYIQQIKLESAWNKFTSTVGDFFSDLPGDIYSGYQNLLEGDFSHVGTNLSDTWDFLTTPIFDEDSFDDITDDMEDVMKWMVTPLDLEEISTGLDAWGMEPYTGWIADVGNAGISLFQGDFINSLLYGVSVIPGIDYGTKPLIMQRKYNKYSKHLDEAMNNIKKDNLDIKTIDTKTLSKYLDDVKLTKEKGVNTTIPKSIKEDILSDKNTYDYTANLIKDLNPQQKTFRKKVWDYMNTPSSTSMFGYRDKPWISIASRDGKGLKPWEKLVIGNTALNLNPFSSQSYFGDRGIEGQTSGNFLADLGYSSTFKGPMEYGWPLVTQGAGQIGNVVDMVFGTGKDGAFKETWDLGGFPMYDNEGHLIGYDWPLSGKMRPVSKDKKGTDTDSTPKIEITDDIRSNLQNQIIEINDKYAGDRAKKTEVLKAMYDSSPDEIKTYLKKRFPRQFGSF